MAKKKAKKKKVTPAPKLRKKSIELAKTIAKTRDGYRCVKCGKSKEQGWKIDGSHVHPVGLCGRLAADPLNVKALCARCHHDWHHDPVPMGKWYCDVFPDRVKYLNKKRLANRKLGTITRLEWQEIYDDLKLQLDQLTTAPF